MSAPRERPFAFRRAFRLPGTRTRVQAEASEELRFHIEGRIDDLMARGMSREDAERDAWRRFGDPARWESELRAIDHATVRQRDWREGLHAVGRDIAYAVRGMLRQPMYATVVVLTLGLGIGANTAIFSIVDRVLLRPMPTPWLDRMLMVRDALPSMGLDRAPLSPAESRDLFARTDLFERSAAYTNASHILTGTGESKRIATTRTLGDFFEVLGARPHLGRFYRDEDSEEGRPRVVVLSHGLWLDAFGADSSIVGRSIALSDVAYTVIGVAAPDVRYPRSAQLWMPFEMTALWRGPERRFSLFMDFVGVRRPSVSFTRAEAGLKAEANAWHERLNQQRSDHSLIAIPFQEYISGELRPILVALVGAVSLVLLIACANIGSLQLVRASARAKELALRAALGAGRAAIARQLLIESLVLAIVGGLLGAMIGKGALYLLADANIARYPQLQDVRLDATALAFTGGIAVLAGMLFGVVPALRASRVDLGDALKEGGRGSSSGPNRQRFLQTSVVVQVALTLVLLLGSVLTIRSLARLLAIDPGFRPERVVTLRVNLPTARYAVPRRSPFFAQFLDRLRTVPGFESVSLVSGLPFSGDGDSSPFRLTGIAKEPNEPERHANITVAAPDYFRTMGIVLVRGRDFGAVDASTGRIAAIVDERLVEQYFHGIDPIGKDISQGPDATIIGVVRSVKQSELNAPLKATVYYDFRQYSWLSGYQVVIRTALPTDAVARLARGVLAELDPQLPLYDVRSMEQRVADSVGARRLAVNVLSAFAALSLVLALLGIYGVISYRTAQRTQEIGIRMALGARPAEVTAMVVRGGMTLAALGLAVGTVVYLGAGRLLQTLLYGISPHDPPSIVGCILVIAVVAFGASLIPARRAARVDPSRAMRSS
jgi:putative ABC transport system permease protein